MSNIFSVFYIIIILFYLFKLYYNGGNRLFFFLGPHTFLHYKPRNKSGIWMDTRLYVEEKIIKKINT